MESHLPGAVADLLANGLDATDLAHLMMIPVEDVPRVEAGEEPSSLNVAGAMRLGMMFYALEELKKSHADPARRALLLQATAWLTILEPALQKREAPRQRRRRSMNKGKSQVGSDELPE